MKIHPHSIDPFPNIAKNDWNATLFLPEYIGKDHLWPGTRNRKRTTPEESYDKTSAPPVSDQLFFQLGGFVNFYLDSGKIRHNKEGSITS
jgi:hypothetical protein